MVAYAPTRFCYKRKIQAKRIFGQRLRPIGFWRRWNSL